MTISKNRIDDCLTIALDGRLDSITSPELQAVVKENIVGVKKLVFDFDKLEYMSSAGLRVILSAQKTMNKQGEMQILNAHELVRSVFAITGMESQFNFI